MSLGALTALPIERRRGVVGGAIMPGATWVRFSVDLSSL
jgi:hypothetical protein